MNLQGKNISVHFQGVKAVDGVDVTLAPGEILGLIGPNGAGKTTLMNALSGFVPLTAGRLCLGDRELTGWRPNRLARLGLSRTFQNVRLFGGLSVFENVEVAGLGVGYSRRAARRRAEEVLNWLGMSSWADLYCEELSFGEEQRVGIARALATRPAFLLLDEPAAGLNEREGDQLMELIARIRSSEGCGIMIIEHDMRLVMTLCDRIHVLDNGVTIAEGPPERIQGDPAVKTAYLGTRRLPGEQKQGEGAPRTPSPRSNASGHADTGAAPPNRTTPPLLEVQDLKVSYGAVPALRGVSVRVHEGEIVGIVGPNGAGKSTLLMSVAGAIKPDAGEVRLSGTPLTGRPPEDVVRRGVSLVPERRRIFGHLTVEENLRVATTTRSNADEVAEELESLFERFPVLWERRDSRGGSLSGGQQQQLAIARALLARPRLLLVDEPSLGLAPQIVERVFESLIALRGLGVSILVVEQNAFATIEMSDRVYVLSRGEIEQHGEAVDDAARAAMMQSYVEKLGLHV